MVPDGTRIAYGSEGDLWVKDVSAPAPTTGRSSRKRPAITEERPVWSPDGNTLYYNRDDRSAGPNATSIKRLRSRLAGAEKPGSRPTRPKTTGSRRSHPTANDSATCVARRTTAPISQPINVNGAGAAPSPRSASATSTASGPRTGPGSSTRSEPSRGEPRRRDINGGDSAAAGDCDVAKHFDGNADWATNFSPKCDAKNVNVGVNGFVSIALSCIDPDAGFGAAPPTPTPLDDSASNSPRNRPTGRSGASPTARSSTRRTKTSKAPTASPTSAADETSNRHRRP